MNKTTYNLTALIVIIVSLFTLIYSCGLQKGEPYAYYDFWNPDSSKYVTYKEYTLGVFGGGYSTIEFDGREILRYELQNVVAGNWIDNNTIRLLSNKPPTLKFLESTKIKFELFTTDNHNRFNERQYTRFFTKTQKVANGNIN